MVTKEQAIACSEMLGVIRRLNKGLVKKIPAELIKFYECNQDVNYRFEYDDTKKFSEQELSYLGKANLVSLYRNYFVEESNYANAKDLKAISKKEEKSEWKVVAMIEPNWYHRKMFSIREGLKLFFR